VTTAHPASSSGPSVTPASPARPTAADVARQIRDVLADLPRFLTAPLLRRWHLRWGATPTEVAAAMPGDALVPHARYRATRGITITATPEEVWPWLVQVGCLRGGWYADDLLDNLAHPSTWQIVPGLQSLALGKLLPMAPTPSAATAFVVEDFRAPDWMLWRTPNSSWTWQLTALSGNRTRLLTRLHACPDRTGVLATLLVEIGDFPMMRRMLRGIRARAEAEHRRRTPRPVNRERLAAIRAVHTVAWASIEACVGYLLWSGATGRSDRRAAVAAAVVTGECLVFAADGFRCPLTQLAEDAGAPRGSVTDIYLPRWFARSLPAIHLPVLVLIVWLHRRALRRLRVTPREKRS